MSLSKIVLYTALLMPAAYISAASAETTATADASVSHGEIRKVDKDAGKITIRHGELKNINMAAMTMAFDVDDKAMLDHLKPGDKIDFVASNPNGQLTATKIDIVK